MADEQKGTAYKVLIPVVSTDLPGSPEDDSEPVTHPITGQWREVTGTWTAANDVAAIRAADKAHGPFDFGAVAVPARSWRPRKPKDETIQKRLWT
jgi:hypothetical protein